MLKNWWRALAPRPRTVSRKHLAARRPLNKTRLAVESLEDRFAPALITVTSLADNMDVDGAVTLREALEAANTDASVDGSVAGAGADEIVFEPTLFATPQSIDLALGALGLSSDVTITGPGAGLLSVRNSAGRVFSITGDATALHGLTVSGDAGGGGIDFNSAGALDIDGAALTANSAADGGALAVAGGGAVTIENSLIAGNDATGSGGGIHVDNGVVTLTNVTLSGNTAGGDGGAIAVADDGTLNLVNSTLAQNHANADNDATGDGGGLFVASLGTVDSVNTIIADNVDNPDGGGPSDIHPDVSGAVNSLGTNLIGDTDGSSGFGAADILDVDALLAPLGDYDGPTQTHALLPGSRAIDAGQTGVVGTLTIPGKDQRGITRTMEDLGAFESRGFTITIDSGNNQRTLIDTDFDDALQVIVESAFDEPVEGGRVTFTVIDAANGASAVLSTTDPVTIAADGTAQVTATANGTGSAAGTPYQVEVSASGATAIEFELTNQVVAALAFQNQPTDTKSGQVINAVGGVTVALFDQDGEFVPKATDSVAVVASGLGLASGTTPVNAVAGVATFDDLVINKAGDDYTLTASLPDDASVPAALSDTFDITASKLIFKPAASDPNPVRSADQFTVTVEAWDETDAIALNFNGAVAVAIKTAVQVEDNNLDVAGDATLSGTLTVSAASGSATFDTLALDLWGNYTLEATSADVAAAESDTIIVTARSLEIATQPDHVRSGDEFTVLVRAVDVTGDVAMNFIGNVEVSIETAEQVEDNNLDILGDAVLGGTTSVAAIDGVATFDDLTLDKWGDYTLEFADDGTPTDLDDVITDTFIVTARALEITTQPPDHARSGDEFDVVVQAIDSTGDVALNFISAVTASIDTAVQVEDDNLDIVGAAVLGGTTTVAAIAGVATFDDLTLDKWGDYTLELADSGTPTNLDDAVTDTIIVTARRLEVAAQPPDHVRSGDEFDVVIRAVDITGDVAMNFTSDVTVSINTAVQVEDSNLDILGDAVLGGTTTVAALAGVATFDDLTLDKWGDYTLEFADAGTPTDLDDVITDTFVITARRLAFLAMDAFVRSGNETIPLDDPSRFVVRVEALDVTGDRALNFIGEVTLSLASAVQGAVNVIDDAEFGGNTVADAELGLAVFNRLTLDKWGDYTLRAVDEGTPTDLINVVSGTITVTARQLDVRLPVEDPKAVKKGKTPSKATVTKKGIGRGRTQSVTVIKRTEVREFPFFVTIVALDITGDRALNFNQDVFMELIGGKLKGLPAIGAAAQLVSEEPSTHEEDNDPTTINRKLHKEAVNGLVRIRARVTGVGAFRLEVSAPNAPAPPIEDITVNLRRNTTGRRRP